MNRTALGSLLFLSMVCVPAATACSGRTIIDDGSGVSGGDGGTTDGGGDGSTSPPPPPDGRVPSVHRPAPTTCTPYPVPPEPVIPDAGLGPSAHFDCHHHADCTEHPRGSCIFFPTSIPTDPGGTRCVYECLTDADCASGTLCDCNGGSNTCISATCQVDADCGAKGYCSPEVDGCGMGREAWHCHTPQDECLEDSDCKTPTSVGNQACRVSGTKWICQMIGCGSAG